MIWLTAVVSLPIALALPSARLVSYDDDDQLDRPVKEMRRSDVIAELARREDDRPGIVGPIVMMPIGLALGGANGLLIGLALSSSGVGVSWLGSVNGVLAISGAVVGVGLLVAGIVMFVQRLVERGKFDERTAALRSRLAELDALERT